MFDKTKLYRLDYSFVTNAISSTVANINTEIFKYLNARSFYIHETDEAGVRAIRIGDQIFGTDAVQHRGLNFWFMNEEAKYLIEVEVQPVRDHYVVVSGIGVETFRGPFTAEEAKENAIKAKAEWDKVFILAKVGEAVNQTVIV